MRVLSLEENALIARGILQQFRSARASDSRCKRREQERATFREGTVEEYLNSRRRA